MPSARLLSWTGIALIFTIGLIHAIEAPGSFEEAAYKGWLFCANGLGALIAAAGIYQHKRRVGWSLGLLIAVGSLLGYAVSRTLGLPGIPAEPDAWFEPLGVASVLAEGMFVVVWMQAATRNSQHPS